MGRRGSKRLDLWLPTDHWIWTVPEKSRTAVTKKCLEFGSQDVSSLLADLNARLAAIEKALARLEQKIDALPDLSKQKPEDKSDQEKRPVIDAAAFFDI